MSPSKSSVPTHKISAVRMMLIKMPPGDGIYCFQYSMARQKSKEGVDFFEKM
jgi:hypothetical protein